MTRLLIKHGTVLPTLAKGKHSKISSGSALIELHCSESQGRYLEVSNLVEIFIEKYFKKFKRVLWLNLLVPPFSNLPMKGMGERRVGWWRSQICPQHHFSQHNSSKSEGNFGRAKGVSHMVTDLFPPITSNTTTTMVICIVLRPKNKSRLEMS